LRSTFVALLLVTGFYLMTAIVYDEGGFGVQLVVKPHPSLTLVVPVARMELGNASTPMSLSPGG